MLCRSVFLKFIRVAGPNSCHSLLKCKIICFPICSNLIVCDGFCESSEVNSLLSLSFGLYRLMVFVNNINGHPVVFQVRTSRILTKSVSSKKGRSVDSTLVSLI